MMPASIAASRMVVMELCERPAGTVMHQRTAEWSYLTETAGISTRDKHGAPTRLQVNIVN